MKNPRGAGGTALVVGATSDIGRAVARRLAGDFAIVQLAARDAGRLGAEARDLRLRGRAEVREYACDVLEPDGGASLVESLDPLPDVVVCVVGLMHPQREAERTGRLAGDVMRTNYVGPAMLFLALGEAFERRGAGVLVGVSSVAGDRGRQSNYLYGSAKAGFSAFLSGLRNRLAARGVHVMTVKPGFVRTRMTDGMDLPGLLTVEPAAVAEAVVRALRRRRDVVYVPGWWRLAMWLVGAIPEALFKRLKL